MKGLIITLGRSLRRPWAWTLLVTLGLGSLVWILGPLLAFAGHSPWAAVSHRLATLCGLFLAWGLGMVLLQGWQQRQQRQRLATEAGQQDQLRAERIDDEAHELQSRARNARRTLQGAGLYRGRSQRWRRELPHYLLLGPEGAGKTSLLDFSGLDFPLNGEKSRLTRDVSGTRHCDWYFAEQGVLLDTAGRYLTQGDAPVDGSAWLTLLRLLRRQRRTRPLNGILVTLPVERLASGNEVALETLARQVRARLHDVARELRVEVPVYLVLTQADRLPGFGAFFDGLSREESEQVLGTTFREAQNGTDTATLRQEFEELLRRLNSQVIPRIHQERDGQRRGQILDFPHQLGRLADGLTLFVELAFSGNRYQRAAQLRGFYLTSTPALTQSLDAQTQGIGDQLGLPSTLLPQYRSGQPRFIRQLFSRVIFPEASLAGLDQREVRRLSWGQRGLYAAALAGLALGAALWTASFGSNHERLERLRDLAQHGQQARSQLKAGADARALLPLLDNAYAGTQVFPAVGATPLRERTGLYQGDAVRPTTEAAYRQALESYLLPRLKAQLEERIRGSLGDRERLIGHLRAYLMLQLPERRDARVLRDWAAADWSQRYPGDALTQNSLDTHLARLLEQGFAAYPVDAQLVSQARQLLRSESLAAVVYRILRDQASGLPVYRLSQHLGPQALAFEGADYPIPGFYTRQGYEQTFSTQGLAVIHDLAADNWVLGDGDGITGMDLRHLQVELEQLYFRDYANLWSEALARVTLQPVGDANQGALLLAGLTSANSPLLQLLLEVRNNTRLAAVASDATGQGDPLPDTARRSLQTRFENLHRLLDDQGTAVADLAPAMAALNDLQQQLAGLAHASAPEQAAFDLAKARMAGNRDALNSLRTAASRLPVPVNSWLGLLVDDSWNLILAGAYDYLNDRYQNELLASYRNGLDRRYPFKADSESDVSLADFREFFKAQGIADTFFDTYLKPFVIRSDNAYRLRAIDGHSLPLSREFLIQMGRTQQIRRGFFAENPAEPGIIFKLEPHSLDPSLTRADLSIGKERLEYRHGPIVAATFRWPQSDALRTTLVLEELGGRRVGLEQDGSAWSLFRLLDRLKLQQHSARDVMLVQADLDGRHAGYLLSSQRSPNPFDLATLRGFKLPERL
ncbi:type VI secretion system membrane subunit TssM [Pseudomonas oryzihabitans]|uniref:type VI secretion system membrane subunit TssM n=1 Tax=Pseudomonas oryzihabitans TaxID=47885 RepID=UPI002894471C|nr:type VI secretion system membrane subunit TssM [Pseudomonas oryzihabitans]MDT3719724.1 type VI secretion system membrane subunit TssM [Pseudomonas oryzihabitans]